MFRGVTIIATMLAGMVAHTASAEDRASWFESLKQPATGYSCCDIADCRRTEATWRAGQWWAVVDSEWQPIPRRKQLDKVSIDGDAYVCSGPMRIVYCFVPPTLGM